MAEVHGGDRPTAIGSCDIDALIGSLVGKSYREILAGLDSATELHARLRQERRTQARPADEATEAAEAEAADVTRHYSAFAAGALFFLLYAKRTGPDFVPAGVRPSDFRKLRPLVEDMAARGMAHQLLLDWLAATS